jgi:hypothetical protein
MVVASSLDGGCRDGWGAACQAALVTIVEDNCPADQLRCLVLVACGEAWDLTALDTLFAARANVRLLVLHASTALRLLPSRWPAVHLPVAATSFGERALGGTTGSPLALLLPASAMTASAMLASALSPARGSSSGAEDSVRPHHRLYHRPHLAAHLYFRCDRPDREAFARLLHTAASAAGKEVHFLGHCHGEVSTGRDVLVEGAEEEQRRVSFAGQRFKEAWHDDAVEAYRPFRFVVCFENSGDEGYVTEKAVSS